MRDRGGERRELGTCRFTPLCHPSGDISPARGERGASNGNTEQRTFSAFPHFTDFP